ncbi:holo-ACP synthase/triphosphoribosyl-dephospho-CoA synthase [Weissella uvarum]|uniref:citrate lyase holo-[acyl-carrier protein] synthase n=1 Tax=Weissella uvarum TaxID=1479233 RepID=UPI00195FA131|nr:citrate lyase holo-[acyl-carrier protein] synthase [Weissella uvarum]MBM7617027.1 holo-ACP synthase/triphosphoribosyl-dephospho-CoA synthase [Weissella uvarum]MCM0595325.1 citrate lyase holo-[acyl-carrier protein] synthase [Weissella uvarum]
MTDIFDAGEPTSLEAIMTNNAWRERQENELSKQYPEQTILSFRLDVPGLIKQSPTLVDIFSDSMRRLERLFRPMLTYRVDDLQRVTGPEAFLVLNECQTAVQMLTYRFEQTDPLGYMFNLDVVNLDPAANQFSRHELGFPEKACVVCGDDAKICMGVQKHSIDEVTRTFNQRYTFYVNKLRVAK